MSGGAFELGLFAIALGAELLLILFGLLMMRGGVADVLSVMAQLPTRFDADDGQTDDETARKLSRRVAIKEFEGLLLRRSVPGGVLLATGVPAVAITLFLGLRRLW